MQGDIFHMEQVAVQVCATQAKPISLPLEDNAHAEVAIYNEDDLSHLLYSNHMHHDGHKHKVIVNHVYRDGFSTPSEFLSTGTQTPVSETGESPVFSDCESDFDEDGFEFPVFLGRQAEESAPQEMAESSLKEPASDLSQRKPEDDHIADISGPLMSWWPGPMELMEHEWIEEKTVESKNANLMPSHQHVSSIEGSLMSWWPTPPNMMEHEWNEKFYE